MPIMVERASNADRARYALRTSPSAHRRKDQTIKIYQGKRIIKPEGVGSGRLGNCSPRLPRIRTCGFPASGSSAHGFAT